MRNALLASVALAGLFACGSLAAQTAPGAGNETHRSEGGAEKGMTGAPATPQARPAERSAQAPREPSAERKEGGKEMGAGEKAGGEKREQSQNGMTPNERKSGETGASGKPSTTGAASTETKPAPHAEQREPGAEKNRTGANENGRTTTGHEATKTGQNPSERTGANGSGNPTAQSGPAERTNPTAQSNSERTNPTAQNGGGRAGAGAQANLDDSQRSKLQSFVARDRSARLDRPDFQLNVGVRVPEHVRFRPLPGEIVSILPEYRGDDYVVVNDEIVIIQPRTREIVMVLPAGGEGRGRVPAYHARLDRRQQQVVYRDVIRAAHPLDRSMEVTVGERIPADIDLMPLPEVVADDMPDIRDYRYFVVNREVVLVDPQTREIVDIIRE